MAESIKDNGKTTTCTGMESTLGRTAECTKATTKMIESMGMESILGTTVNSMKAGGKMANSTEKASTARMEETDVAIGKMERELNGLMMSTQMLLDKWQKMVQLTERSFF